MVVSISHVHDRKFRCKKNRLDFVLINSDSKLRKIDWKSRNCVMCWYWWAPLQRPPLKQHNISNRWSSSLAFMSKSSKIWNNIWQYWLVVTKKLLLIYSLKMIQVNQHLKFFIWNHCIWWCWYIHHAQIPGS